MRLDKESKILIYKFKYYDSIIYMNKLKIDDRELVNNILDILQDKKINFNKKKDVIKTYENINKLILENGFSAYDINNLITKNKSLQISKFLKSLVTEYNNILYKNLCKYNFKDDNSLKTFCSLSKTRGFKKIKSGILDIAKKKMQVWEGMWSFCDYKKGKINNLKLIDPDILNKLNI